jgi:hypothetical protein
MRREKCRAVTLQSRRGGDCPCAGSIAPCSLCQGRFAPASPVPPLCVRPPRLPLRVVLCRKAGRDERMVVFDRTKGWEYEVRAATPSEADGRG